jgi:translation elongation factor EF-Ts
MITATWCGKLVPDVEPCCNWWALVIGSHAHDIFFFGHEQLIDFLHVIIGQLLHFIGLCALLIFGDFFILFLFLQFIHSIAASNPQYMTLDAVPADAKAKELDVSKTKAEKLFNEFVAFETSMQKYKDKFTGKERNFSEKTFEAKLKEFNQRAVNLDSLIDDVVTKSASEDRQDKQDAEKTQKLLNVFFEEVAFMLKKVRSYGDDAASKARLADLYFNETVRDAVLFEQIFVIDGKTKVGDVISNASSDVGAPVALKAYTRFALGEGIEKAADDFAAEVAKVSGVA